MLRDDGSPEVNGVERDDDGLAEKLWKGRVRVYSLVGQAEI